jgi:hypothetical protein
MSFQHSKLHTSNFRFIGRIRIYVPKNGSDLQPCPAGESRLRHFALHGRKPGRRDGGIHQGRRSRVRHHGRISCQLATVFMAKWSASLGYVLVPYLVIDWPPISHCLHVQVVSFFRVCFSSLSGNCAGFISYFSAFLTGLQCPVTRTLWSGSSDPHF